MKPTREELVKNYINLVYYFARRWAVRPEDADDMVQETYKKALMNYNAFNYQSESQLKSWLLTICRNTFMDSQKLKKKTTTMDINVIEDETTTEGWLEGEIKKEEKDTLKQSLQQLDSDEFDVINLRYLNDFSFKQLAETLHLSEAQAKMRCYRAIAKLKKLITL